MSDVPRPGDPSALEWLLENLIRKSEARYGSGCAAQSERRGAHLLRCPWHDDEHPSLRVFTGDDGKARYHCFACPARGDSWDLAEDLGVVVLERTPVPRPERSPAAAGAFDSERAVARAFLDSLSAITARSLAGQRARRYLRGRRIRISTAEALGLRVPSDDVAGDACRLPTHSLERIGFFTIAHELGLVSCFKRSGYRFPARFRVLVPIVDLGGDLHAIVGRTTSAHCAADRRYKRWRARAPRDTSVSLWPLGGPGVADAIRASGVAILVPGFAEACVLWQAGVRNVLATMGDRLPSDDDFAVLQDLGVTRIVFAYHIGTELGSLEKAQLAQSIALLKWGMPALVDAFRGRDGLARDADELPPGRLRREARRLVDEVRRLSAPATEAVLVRAVQAATRGLERMRHQELRRLVDLYRSLADKRGPARRAAFFDRALPIRTQVGAKDMRGTFPVPDIDHALHWEWRNRPGGEPWPETWGAGPVERLVPETAPLDFLVLLSIWRAQSAAWARGSRRGVPLRLAGLAARFGTATSAVHAAVRRLVRTGVVADFSPFVAKSKGARARGARRYRTHRYVALLRRANGLAPSRARPQTPEEFDAFLAGIPNAESDNAA